MSKRLDSLYQKYLEIKEALLDFTTDSDDTTPTITDHEIGQLYLVDDFYFLLIAETDNYCTGYKVHDWVDFATNKDFIFDLDGIKYFAILEHELFIPKEKVTALIGTISDKYVDILYKYETNDEPIPDSYTGLTIPYDTSYAQIRFRQAEMRDVKHYISNKYAEI